MGMFGKIGAALGQIGKYYTSPEGAQSGLAILQDYGTGGSENYRALQMQRQKMAQEQQQQQAMAALMARMRGPDTQTPVVNQMIDMNNQRMGAFQNGMEHQQGRMDVTKPGLPMDQETMSLLAKYGASGGNMQIPLAMSQMLQPEPPPEPKFFNTRNAVVAVDPASMQARPIYEAPIDPLDAEYRRAQIASVRAQERQRNHAAGKPYFAPPRSGGGGGGLGGLPPGYAPR